MRRRIVERLNYLLGRDKGYLVKYESIQEAKANKQAGAILWLGTIRTEDEQGSEPGEFATLDLERRTRSKLIVHNLPMLLGEAYIDDLRKSSPEIFDTECVMLRDRKSTVDVQLRLWKLQAYLADYGYETDPETVTKTGSQ